MSSVLRGPEPFGAEMLPFLSGLHEARMMGKLGEDIQEGQDVRFKRSQVLLRGRRIRERASSFIMYKGSMDNGTADV